MTRSFKELVGSMMGTREGVLPSIQAFPPIDVEQLVRDLRLEARARTAGKSGQPASSAVGPDLVELDILAEIERRARKANEDYQSQLGLYDGRIRRAVLGGNQRVRIEGAGQNVLADFSAALLDDQNHLHLCQHEAEGREQEFQTFRERHGLRRLPKIVPPAATTYSLIMLGVFVLIESFINGNFFAEGSQAGLVGGVTLALVLSSLNVGTAYLYATHLLPLVVHRNVWVKVLGAAGALAFVAWLLGLNLAIGHFRDLFIETADNVRVTEVVDRLSTAPLRLRDAKSGLLVIVGLVLSALTIIRATVIRELYPGFASVGRERERAITHYAEEQTKCLSGMMELRNRAVEGMDGAIELIRNAEFDMQLALEGRVRLHQIYTAFLVELAGLQKRLVQRYRDANRNARKDEVPAYFHEHPPSTALLEPAELTRIPELDQDVRQDVITRIELYIRLVNEKFEQSIPKYRSVKDLTSAEVSRHATA